MPGIGHNQGPPLDGGFSWRRHVWTKARKQLMPRLPLEVVRRRVRRATELGLQYPAYASILLGTGRDIVGFLFTCDALGLRLERGIDLPETVADKLHALERCDRLLGVPKDASPELLSQRLAAMHRIDFSGTAVMPVDDCPLPEGRAALQAALKPLKLPPDAVVMIGTRAQERAWADAARLAQFMPADRYFAA